MCLDLIGSFFLTGFERILRADSRAAFTILFLHGFLVPSGGSTGGTGGALSPPIPKSRQKLSKKNGIKLVRYTFRLKNYVKIPQISLRFFRPGAATACPGYIVKEIYAVKCLDGFGKASSPLYHTCYEKHD